MGAQEREGSGGGRELVRSQEGVGRRGQEGVSGVVVRHLRTYCDSRVLSHPITVWTGCVQLLSVLIGEGDVQARTSVRRVKKVVRIFTSRRKKKVFGGGAGFLIWRVE